MVVGIAICQHDKYQKKKKLKKKIKTTGAETNFDKKGPGRRETGETVRLPDSATGLTSSGGISSDWRTFPKCMHEKCIRADPKTETEQH